MDNTYKLLQIQEVLMSEYSYVTIYGLNNGISNEKEIWMYNSNNEYKVIRISLSSAENFYYDKNQFDLMYSQAKVLINEDYKVLHIFVNTNNYDETILDGNYINIDDGFISGSSAVQSFNKLVGCVKTVSDIRFEIKRLNDRVKEFHRNRRKKILKDNSLRLLPVKVIMAICLIVYLLSVFISKDYSSITSYVVLGGLYKTFTIGLNQTFRLITYSFVHGGLLHLLCNMYALYIVGQFICLRYDPISFLFILFSSIFMGGITQTLLFENTVCVGMSAGIYGLFFVYIASVISDRMANLQQLLPIILINLSLNFLSQTAWVAHLGGLMGGMVAFFIISKEKQERLGPIILYVVLIISMLIKLYTTKTINPIYMGTDLEIVKFFKDIGLTKYASSLSTRLFQIYSKFGG